MNSEKFRLAWLLSVALLWAGVVAAQGYPNRPIRLVVPYPPGGGTDVVARTLAQKMNEVMGQPVIVDNRPGANGIIGSDVVAKAASDGYTVLITLATHVINPALYAKLPYGPDDHVPVTVLAEYPFVITVHPRCR
jgi:tripartite-type tricarboxylate transporter receptor subunit TctC